MSEPLTCDTQALIDNYLLFLFRFSLLLIIICCSFFLRRSQNRFKHLRLGAFHQYLTAFKALILVVKLSILDVHQSPGYVCVFAIVF